MVAQEVEGDGVQPRLLARLPRVEAPTGAQHPLEGVARRSSASTRSPVRTIRKRSSASAWSAYTRSKAFPCIAMMMAEKKIRDQRQVSVRSLV